MIWHGHLERARKYENVIGRMKIDVDQNSWFANQGLRLVRVLEKDFDELRNHHMIDVRSLIDGDT